MGYFWGIFYLYKHGFRKVIGSILFTVSVLMNLILVATPYDTQAEFVSTRMFTVSALGASIFLIFRRSNFAKITGILLLIISIFSLFLGAILMMAK